MKNSIKKFSVLLLSLAFVLCAFTLTVFGFNSAKADAVAEFSLYQMEESVSIKQVENGGIRFRVKMDANTKALIDSADDVTYGFIITPMYFYENRTADTAETHAYGVDDYISSIAKYAGETGVGILGDKAKIYQEGDYYYANGVLEGIGNDSPDLKYIAIAYVKDGSGFKYATFDADNAIDIKTAASKIYLEERSDIEEIRKIDILADFGAETNPVLISNDADMYALSTATNDGFITGEYQADLESAVETINFKVLDDITFDCHVAPVASDFVGAVDYNEKTIDLVNGGANPLTHAFAGHTDDCTVCNPVETLITMTPKISNVISGTSWPESYVANEDFPYDCGDYTGDFWKVTPSVGCISIKIFYTAEELTALSAKYNCVKFSYYIHNPNGTSIYNSDKNDTGVFNDEKYTYSSTAWRIIEMPIETVIANISDGWLALMGQGSGQPNTWDIYFSDFTFTWDFNLFDADTVDPATGLVQYNKGGSINTTKATRIEDVNLPNNDGYDGSAIRLSPGSQYALYAKISFDMTNYEGKTVAEAITAYAESLGVTHIRINYYIDSTRSFSESTTFTEAGVIPKVTKGEWVALEVEVSTFVSNLGKVASNATGDKYVPTEYHLFLFRSYVSGSGYLYLGDIEFVQPA